MSRRALVALIGLAVVVLAVGAVVGLVRSPQVTLTPIAQTGGVMVTADVQGTYAYVGMGQRLAVVHVADPSQPVFTGWTPPFRDLVRSVAVSGDVAVVAATTDGLHVVDVSEPSAPRVVASLPMVGEARSVAIDDGVAFVASWGEGLVAVDISDPSSPTILSVSGRRAANHVAVAEGRAYITSFDQGAVAFDVSDPTAPRTIAQLSPDHSVTTVSADGDRAVLGGLGGVSLVTYNGDTPVVATLISDRSVGGLDLNGDELITSSDYQGAAVFDISDRASPVVVTEMETPGSVLGAMRAGEFVYVVDWLAGLHIFDTADAREPVLVGAFREVGHAISTEVRGGTAYVTNARNGLFTFDRDAGSERAIGYLPLPGQELSLDVQGDHAYVVEILEGLATIDGADPTAPAEVSRQPLEFGRDVLADGNWLYITMATRGLRTYDISVPSAPHGTAVVDTPGYANGMARHGSMLYVADGVEGLQLFDLADPSQPRPVATWDSPGLASKVVVEGNYLYLADGAEGIHVLNVSDPPAPTYVTSIPVSAPGRLINTVAADGDRLYASEQPDAIRVFDISDPGAPQQVGLHKTVSRVQDLEVAGDGELWVAGGDAGVSVLSPSRGLTLRR